jgi:hypothetical protein
MRVNELFEDDTPNKPRPLNRATPVHQSEEEDQAISHQLGPEYAVAINSEFEIYRGMEKGGQKVLKGSSLGTARASRNTSDFYNVLVSQLLPSWKQFPPRAHSFICTNHMGTARSYGGRAGTYRVFPKGDPIIGICPRGDFWNSFISYGFKSFAGWDMNDFNKGMAKLIGGPATAEHIGASFSGLDVCWEDAKAGEGADELLDSLQSSGLFIPKLVPNIVSKYKNFSECIEDLLDPIKNGFTCARLSQIVELANPNPDGSGCELWFSGEAYFVQEQNPHL